MARVLKCCFPALSVLLIGALLLALVLFALIRPWSFGSKYDRISEGMTEDDVEAILGEPESKWPPWPEERPILARYRGSRGPLDSSDEMILLEFEDNRIIRKMFFPGDERPVAEKIGQRLERLRENLR
jgi:hypothetical protein